MLSCSGNHGMLITKCKATLEHGDARPSRRAAMAVPLLHLAFSAKSGAVEQPDMEVTSPSSAMLKALITLKARPKNSSTYLVIGGGFLAFFAIAVATFMSQEEPESGEKSGFWWENEEEPNPGPMWWEEDGREEESRRQDLEGELLSKRIEVVRKKSKKDV